MDGHVSTLFERCNGGFQSHKNVFYRKCQENSCSDGSDQVKNSCVAFKKLSQRTLSALLNDDFWSRL